MLSRVSISEVYPVELLLRMRGRMSGFY
jgi:hypothetical protein